MQGADASTATVLDVARDPDVRADRVRRTLGPLLAAFPYRSDPLLLVEDVLWWAVGPEAVHRPDLQSLLLAALEETEAGPPTVGWGDIREDAAFWAALSSPRALETYLQEIARAMQGKWVPPGMMKRLVAWAYRGLRPEDRRAFVAKVDPRGSAKGRGGRDAA